MLKKVAKRAGQGLFAVLALVAGLALYVQIDGIPRYSHVAPERHAAVTPEHAARGKKLVGLLCAGCHLDPSTKELSGKVMAESPKEFGVVVSRNITKSKTHGIGAWSDGDIAYLLRTGVRKNGEYAPPYMVKLPHLSDDDVDSIIAFLRSDDPLVAAADIDPPGVPQPSFLVKALTHAVFKPLPYPSAPIVAPNKSDRVAYGRYLVQGLDCYSCHSADFKTVNVLEPEKTPGYLGGGNGLLDADGAVIRSANLTADDETGIGRWSEADFVRALKMGFRPDGSVVHYPMTPMPELDDDEAGSIYAYLRTVPKLHNAVQRASKPAAPVEADEGKRAYYKYGCPSCHGQTGQGSVGDLRRANEDFPTDEQLVAWIKNAPSIRPGTKMPAWNGIIAEEDYAPLVAHVRKLSEGNVGKKTASN
jgi:mono/diheme cytochrome c family protein